MHYFFYLLDDIKEKLLWASEYGKIDIVRDILMNDPSLVNSADEDGYTPLHRAAYKNYPEIIQVIIFVFLLKK